MKFEDLFDAIVNLRPGAKFILRTNFQGLEWLDEEQQAPTEAEVLAEVARIEAGKPLALLREARDLRLAQTDWWVLPDRTATSAQLAYRQALRDITETYTSLDDVVWPVKP